VLAIPYRLVPSDRGLLFAASTVNMLAVAGYAAVAMRRSRTQALVALAGIALLQRGLGIDQITDPWNPTLPILPFALFALLAVELAVAPRWWTLPAAAAVASFVVQAHVGFAQPVALMTLAALALRWHSARRSGARPERPQRPNCEAEAEGVGPDPARTAGLRPGLAVAPVGGRARSRWRQPVPLALVVAVVAWAPALVDQVARTGNLGMLVRWSLGRDVGPGMGTLTEGKLPAGDILGSAAWLLDPVGMWLGRDQPVWRFGYPMLDQVPAVRLLWVPLVLAAAVLLARGRGPGQASSRPVLGAVVIAAAGVVATLGDLQSARGLPVSWPFRWVGVVAMLAWVALGWAAAVALARRFPQVDRADGDGDRDGNTEGDAGPAVGGTGRSPLPRIAAAGLGLALVAVPVALALGRGTLGTRPVQAGSDGILPVADAVVAAARDEPLAVVNPDLAFNATGVALPVLLDRAGVPWVTWDDPRAAGHPRLALAPHDSLEGLTGYAVAVGQADLLVEGDSVILLHLPAEAEAEAPAADPLAGMG
jgi:hypothetical protein